MDAENANPHVTRIRPPGGLTATNLSELWQYRELIWILAVRDIKVRYKQTVLGIAWAILPIFMTMVVFNVLFRLLMGSKGGPTIEGVPYAVCTFCAMVPWQLFANTLDQSGKSLVTERALITKVYFPRLVAPIAPVVSALFDFLIALTFLFLLIAGYHALTEYEFSPSWALLALPPLTLFAAAAALSVAIWVSALSAIYRDFQYALPFLIQILMFVSPVIYPADSILRNAPSWMTVLYGLNPMAGVAEGFRWAILGTSVPDPLLMSLSVFMTVLLLVGGLFYFRHLENEFVDLV